MVLYYVVSHFMMLTGALKGEEKKKKDIGKNAKKFGTVNSLQTFPVLIPNYTLPHTTHYYTVP